MISIDKLAFLGCSALTSIQVESNNPYYSAVDGVIYNKDITELICCPVGKIGMYDIPRSVEIIREGAFSGCSGLTSVNIPNSVTRIEDGAFSECIYEA